MANEYKILALNDIQRRALNAIIKKMIAQTKPKRPKKRWPSGGAAAKTGGVSFALAKMVSTVGPAGWTGCSAPDEITMPSGTARLYVSNGEGGLTLDTEEITVYNPDGKVGLMNGSLVNIAAARFEKTSTGTPGVEDDGGGGGAPAAGEELTITNGETIYLATYTRTIDYLAALDGFGPDKVLSSEDGTCTDIQWLPGASGGGPCETIEVVTNVTCNNGSLQVTKGSLSVITCDTNGV